MHQGIVLIAMLLISKSVAISSSLNLPSHVTVFGFDHLYLQRCNSSVFFLTISPFFACDWDIFRLSGCSGLADTCWPKLVVCAANVTMFWDFKAHVPPTIIQFKKQVY